MDVKPSKINNFHELINKWGENNIEEYPWRNTGDPYEVLVSEFMLHRTQKDQAKKVYLEFMRRYPTLDILKNANREEVKNLLAPLGLNWRIEGMLDVLDNLATKYNEVPVEHDKLIKEPNVGPYIAGATVTFTKNEPQTLIDTNTVRVIGRVFGLNLEGEARRRKEVRETIGKVVDPENPRDYYYAIIDLAHKICHIKEPNCAECPLLRVPCIFGENNL